MHCISKDQVSNELQYEMKIVTKLVRENYVYHSVKKVKKQKEFQQGSWECVVHKEADGSVGSRVVSETRVLRGTRSVVGDPNLVGIARIR